MFDIVSGSPFDCLELIPGLNYSRHESRALASWRSIWVKALQQQQEIPSEFSVARISANTENAIAVNSGR